MGAEADNCWLPVLFVRDCEAFGGAIEAKAKEVYNIFPVREAAIGWSGIVEASDAPGGF